MDWLWRSICIPCRPTHWTPSVKRKARWSAAKATSRGNQVQLPSQDKPQRELVDKLLCSADCCGCNHTVRKQQQVQLWVIDKLPFIQMLTMQAGDFVMGRKLQASILGNLLGLHSVQLFMTLSWYCRSGHGRPGVHLHQNSAPDGCAGP